MKTTMAMRLVVMLLALPVSSAIGTSKGILRHQKALPKVTSDHYPNFPDVYVVDMKRACTGYMLVGCMQYSPEANHGFGPKFWYDEVVPKEDRKLMTRDVCWNFCRNVTGASAFGLQAGRKCFCTPSFDFYATSGGLGDCSWPCEGDADQMCGADHMVNLYEMHDCTNLPPAHCTRAPPQIHHAELFRSRAYYGANIPCKNLEQKVGDTLENSRCDIECKPGYWEQENSLTCKEFGNRLVYTWGQFQGKAVCAPKNCGMPKNVANSRNDFMNVDVYFPNVVTYTCNVGHTTDEKAANNVTQNTGFQVSCTTEGVFSEYKECKPVACEKAGAKTKSNTIMSSPAKGEPTYYGDKVQYQCAKGHTINGQASGKKAYSETCTSSGIQSDTHGCSAVECGLAKTYLHATLKTAVGDNENHTYPTRLDYECDEGYTLSGVAGTAKTFASTCTETGTWDVTKTPCQKVTCGEPPADNNEGHDTKPGFYEGTVTYSCKTGYTLDQQASGRKTYILTCRADGQWKWEQRDGSWAAPPSCEHVDCGVPPAHSNAQFRDSPACPRAGGACWYRDRPYYTCNAGYSTNPLEPNPSDPLGAVYAPMCQANGTFEESKPCQKIDVCVAGGVKDCGRRGQCRVHDVVTGVPLDDYSCDCEAGYEQVIEDGEKTCRNINDCPLPSSFAHNCGGRPAGECDDQLDQSYDCDCGLGFELVALKTPPTNHTCAPMDCGELPAMPNTDYTLAPYRHLDELIAQTQTTAKTNHMVYLRPTVDVTCKDGFQLLSGRKSFSMFCKLMDKQVTMTRPEACVAKSCGSPQDVYLATITGGPSTAEELVYSPVYAERTVNYTCDNGYTPDTQGQCMADPSFTVECLADGQQSDYSACVPVDCGMPESLENAFPLNLKASLKYPFGAAYYCTEGHSIDEYHMDPRSPFKCQANCTFTKAAPCVPMNCGKAPVVNNTVEQENWSGDVRYPKELQYVADPGWTVNGKANGTKEFTVNCTADGSFSSYPKELKRVECGFPHDVANANWRDRMYVFEEKVQYTCKTGYSTDTKPADLAKGNFVFGVECLADGTFEARKECKKVVCENPPSPGNATATSPNPTASKEYQEEIHWTCKPGYTLDGTLQGATALHTKCLETGQFTPVADCINADNCVGNKCATNSDRLGTCVDHEPATGTPFDDYSCDCPPGFEERVKNEAGVDYKYCHNIDDCVGKGGAPKCQPGLCTDGIQSYNCTCYQSGYYEKDTPEKHCAKQDCGEPPVVSNSSRPDGALKFGDDVLYTCDKGHTLTGEVFPLEKEFTVTCNAGTAGEPTGVFSPTEQCLPVGCAAPTAEGNANHEPQTGLVYPQTWKFTCLTGYSLDRQCTGNNWYEKMCNENAQTVLVGNGSAQCESVYAGEVTASEIADADYAPGKMYFGDAPKSVKCKTGYSTNEKDHTQHTFALVAESNCSITGMKSCVIVKCDPAVAIGNTTHSPATSTEYGQKVTYSLDQGYTTTGQKDGSKSFELTCQADGTLDDNRQPVKPVQCGPPPPVSYATRPGGALHFGQSVTYSCSYGYSLDGLKAGAGNMQKVVDCQWNGDFSELPVCEPVKCPAPPEATEATKNVSSGTVFKDVVEYTCGPGWSLNAVLGGPQTFTRRCTAQGTYSPTDKTCQNMDDCAGNKCGGHGTCEDKTDPTGTHLDDYKCNCDSGFAPETKEFPPGSGNMYHVCGNIPDCPPGACEPGGSCRDLINDYECICDAGHYPTNGSPKECNKQSCGEPENGAHSSRPADHKVYQESVTYTCDSGYVVTQEAHDTTFEVTCEAGAKDSQTGSFSPSPPTPCEAIICGIAADFSADDATRTATGQSPADLSNVKYPEVVTWTCDTGYTLTGQCGGDAEFTETCDSGGNFVIAPADPTCQAVEVGIPNLPNATYDASMMYYGDSQTVQCIIGHIAVDGAGPATPSSPVVTSFELGTQSDCNFAPHPTCMPRNCGTPDIVANAVADKAGDHIYYNDVVTYTADPWYSSDGTPAGTKSFTINCQADGDFSGTEPYTPLQLIECAPPTAPASSTLFHVDDPMRTATFQCDEGYSTDGSPQGVGNVHIQVTCQEATATWTAPTKACEKVKCPNVPPQAHAAHSAKPGGYVYQDHAQFTCDAGYTLDGDLGGMTGFSLQCGHDGQFIPTADHCQNANDCAGNLCMPGTCQDADPPSGTHLQDYSCTCPAGYRPAVGGASPMQYNYCEDINECESDPCDPGSCTDAVNSYTCACGPGYYVKNPGATESCEKQACGTAPADAHATVSVAQDKILRVGDTATYTCNEGHTIDAAGDGSQTYTVTCNAQPGNPAPADGTFSGEESCQRVMCGGPPSEDLTTHTVTKQDLSLLGQRSFLNTTKRTADLFVKLDGTGMCHSAEHGFHGYYDDNGAPIEYFQERCATDDNCWGFTFTPAYWEVPDLPFGLMYYSGPLDQVALEEQQEVSGFGPGWDCYVKKSKHPGVGGSPPQETPDLMLYGDLVHYTCLTGHTTSGVCDNADTFDKECTMTGFQYVNGPWSCTPVSAGTPTPQDVPNVRNLNQVEMFYEDYQDLDCKPGYKTSTGGTSFRITAESNCKISIPETCSAITCSPEPVDANADTSGSAVFNAGGLTYSCKAGYSTDGTKGGPSSYTATCQTDGSFSTSDTPCELITCSGSPPTVDHGSTTRSTVMKHGDTADYTCDSGYTGTASTFTINCDAGDIKGLKPCTKVECPVTDRANSKPVNGEGSVFYQDTADFQCNAGKSVDGKPPTRPSPATNLDYSETCQASAALTDSNSCQDIDYCADHSHCSPGTCVNDPARHTGVDYGCDCPAGYEEATQTVSGYLEVKCVDINECDEKGGHGSCAPGGTCNDLIDKFTCTCDDCHLPSNTADGKGQVCESKKCDAPPTIANAAHSGGSSKVNCSTVVSYTCDTGHSTTGTYGDATTFDLTCTSASVYTGQETCDPVSCGIPDPVANEESHSPTGIDIKYDQDVTYTCNTGYTTTGIGGGPTEFTVDCTETGEFSQAESCIIVDCGTPDDRTNAAQPVTPGGTTYNEVATYTCNRGYTTDQDANGPTSYTATCQADGTWDVHDNHNCMPVKCCIPPEFEHASHQPTTAVVYPEQITVTCDPGYTLMGADIEPWHTTFVVECTTGGDYGYRWPMGLEGWDDWLRYVLDKQGRACLPTDCCGGGDHISDGLKGDSGGRGGRAMALMNHGLHEAALHKHASNLARGCRPTTCGVPSDKLYATVQETVPIPIGGLATWDCHTGYSVDGSKIGAITFTNLCTTSGTFAGPSDCQDIDYCSDTPCTANGACFDCSDEPNQCIPPVASASFLQASAGPFGVQSAPDGTKLYSCDCLTDPKPGYETTTDPGYLTCTQDDCHGADCGGGTCIDLSSEPGSQDGDFTCQCNQGYELETYDGPPKTAKCVPGVCEAGGPPMRSFATEAHYSSNGTEKSGPVVYQDYVTYTCVEGFSIDGSTNPSSKYFTVGCPSSLDMSGESWHSCERIKCDPSQLSSIDLNTATLSSFPKDIYEYEETLTFNCNPGYTQSGSAFTIMCQADGTFTHGQCDIVECGQPQHVGNAAASTSAHLTYEQTVDYDCDAGYELKPAVIPQHRSFTATCGADGNIGPMQGPCEQIRCSDTTPEKPEATTMHTGPVYAGTSLVYDCFANASTTGRPTGASSWTLTCDINGNFGAEDLCQTIYYLIEGNIYDTSIPANAITDAKANIFTLQEALGCTFKFYDSVCGGTVLQTMHGLDEDNYVTHNDQWKYVEVNKPGCMVSLYEHWNYEGGVEALVARNPDECVKISDYLTVTLGGVTSAKASFEGVAVSVNGQGYYSHLVLGGHYFVRGSAPDHENVTHVDFKVDADIRKDIVLGRVSCGAPPVVSHASRSTSSDLLSGETVTYTCTAGYKVKSSPSQLTPTSWTATCQDRTIGPMDECEQIVCEGSPPSETGASTMSSGPVHPGDTVFYSCVPGYTTSPAGQFGAGFGFDADYANDCTKSTTGSCYKVSCGRPTQITGATTSTGSELFYEDTVTYTCQQNQGYESKTFTATCTQYGYLNNFQICERRVCESSAPAEPNAIAFHGGEVYAGSTITYFCTNGLPMFSATYDNSCTKSTTGTCQAP